MSASSSSSPLNEKEIEFFFAALHASSLPSPSSSSQRSEAQDPTVKLLKRRQLENCLDKFRMAATNLSLSTSPCSSDLQSAKASLLEALDAAGCLEQALLLHKNRMDWLEMEEQRKSSGNLTFRDKNCYTQQQMQEVVKNLFIGSWHPATDASLLTNCGVTHICCCINVTPRLADKGFQYLILPAEDSPEYGISQHFDKSFQFIDEAMSKKGTGVLVHCGAGISRASTIVAAYLIRKLRVKTEEAVSLIQKVRQVARPNNGFMKQLKKFELDLLREDDDL